MPPSSSFADQRLLRVEAPKMSAPASAKAVDVVIVGGGVCGVLAAHRCLERALTYYIIDRQSDFGGVWASLANQHSHLQVCTATAMLHNLHTERRRHNDIICRLLKPCTDGMTSTRSVPIHWLKFPDLGFCTRCDAAQKMQDCIRTRHLEAVYCPSSSLITWTGNTPR